MSNQNFFFPEIQRVFLGFFEGGETDTYHYLKLYVFEQNSILTSHITRMNYCLYSVLTVMDIHCSEPMSWDFRYFLIVHVSASTLLNQQIV